MPLKNTFGEDISTAGGSVVPTPLPQAPSTINSQNTAPKAPIDYKSPAIVPVYPVSALDPSVPAAPLPATASENAATDITSRLKSLNDRLVGRSADQAAADNAAGLPDLIKSQNDLSSLLKGLQNEAKAIPLKVENDFTGRAGVDQQQLISEQRLRENAIKSLDVSTRLEATKGNIATAIELADRSIKQKYGPIEEEITAAKSNLDLILHSPEYSREDKVRAQAQKEIQDKRQAAIDKAKADEKTKSDIVIKAAQNGADAVTLKKIQEAKTPDEAAVIAGTYGKDRQTQVAEINGRKVLIDSNTGATIKDLGKATGTVGTEGERDSAVLQNYANVFVPGAKLPNGNPVLDGNGYLTPEAFKMAIADYKGPRENFIKKFGYLLYQKDSKPDAKYSLTPAEIKFITG